MSESGVSSKMSEFWIALSQLQAELPDLVKTEKVGAGAYSYTYAPLVEVIKTARPLLRKYGFAIVQFPVSSANLVGVKTILGHSSGEKLEETFATPLPENLDPKKIGGLITYYRRYGYMAVLGIAPEDDDATEATEAIGKTQSKRYATPAQVGMIQGLMKETNTDLSLVLEHYQAENLGNLTLQQASSLISTLKQKAEKIKEEEV